MILVDGISQGNRQTWSRLTRLHTASVGLPMQTSRVVDEDRRREDCSTVI
jgi:hypothetical protein